MTLGQAVDAAITDGAHWVVNSGPVEVLIHRGKLYCWGPDGFRPFTPTARQLLTDDWVPVDHVDLVEPP